MGKEIVIENSPDYLFLQWLGMDYNFWNVVFADVVLIIAFFAIVFTCGFIYFLLGGE